MVFDLPPEVTRLILQTMITAISNAVAKLAGDTIAKNVESLLNKPRVGKKISRALNQAYERFQNSVADKELLTQLQDHAAFIRDNSVIRIVAAVATRPIDYKLQVQQLAERMHVFAPDVSLARCQVAAQTFVEAIHLEIASVKELQAGLLLLQEQEMADGIANLVQNTSAIRESLAPMPEYAAGLEKTLAQDMMAVAIELRHNYLVSAHLLYALSMLPSGSAKAVLTNLALTPSKIKDALRATIKPRLEGVAASLPFTEGLKQTFITARRIARDEKDSETNDSHLLIALLVQTKMEEEQSSTTAVLGVLSVTADQLLESIGNERRVTSMLLSFNVLSEAAD